MSRNEKKIRDVCAELGIYVETLRWDQTGYSGGWILNESVPIGLSTEEAIAYLRESPSHFENVAEREAEEIIFTDCNVCGIKLREKGEFKMGMCLMCAEE